MSARIDADTRPVVIATTGLVASLGLVSFLVSFAGLSAVAAWAELPPTLRWAVPVFVDGALLAYTLAILVQKSRGESVRFSWGALASFTAVSVAANAAHVYGVGDPRDWRTTAGAAIAALAPLGVFAATHTVASLAIARPTVDQDVSREDHPADLPGPPPDRSEPLPDQRRPTPVLLARNLRDKEGLSQRAIAERLGVSKTTVSRWLREEEAHA